MLNVIFPEKGKGERGKRKGKRRQGKDSEQFIEF
jgi:hypothetical protein